MNSEANKASSPTVLVIEDDLEINELLGEYLSLENLKYVQATTGKAGIHHALQQKPDAIILDCMLPDVDGFEIARQLTTRPETFSIPIVMLTCMTQDADRQKGFASGVFEYMHKPFLPDELLNAVHRALEHRKTVGERHPTGTVELTASAVEFAKGVSTMLADVLAKSPLPENGAMQIREGFEWLAGTVAGYRNQHPAAGALKMTYRIVDAAGNTAVNGSAASAIEWTLSEDKPGLLAEIFFKPVTPAPPSSGFHLGWGTLGLGGGKAATTTPPAPPVPQPWLQFLAKTGAASFEKDSKQGVVKFSRALSPASPSVPVVSMDGARYPTRSRDEALANKK